MADPACPWAYSALPALTALRWRYGEQLEWSIVMIGLSETTERYERLGYGPARMAQTPLRFGRFGMPYALGPRSRVIASGRACRAVVAARLTDEELAYPALRALHLAWFTSDLLLDEDDAIAAALSRDPALDAQAIVARLDDPDVEAAYQEDRRQVRTATGSPSALQGKTANGDDGERYTAPTLVFESDGRTFEAGGHQPLAAYDVLVANLDRDIRRRPAPEGALAVLEAFPYGLTTREVSLVVAPVNDPPDDGAATVELLGLVEEGRATREQLGGDALWRSSSAGD
jgi:2-hydroxychromene-2-carboxylate isomerase